MSADKCTTVIAGILEDNVFNHVCFVAESLSTILPNFYFKSICKSFVEWKPWLEEKCALHGWSHAKSPLIWREIGITDSKVTYIGSGYQFWELLLKYYNIASHLTKEELKALRADLIFAHNVKKEKEQLLEIQVKRRRLLVIGGGRSMCSDLIPQLQMTKELWLSHGVVINVYDEPGCYFKLRKIFIDSAVIGSGLKTVNILDSIPIGLKDCDVLIYLDNLVREDYEGTDSWMQRNYKPIEQLCEQINQYAPSSMKVIFCSMGITCFYADIMQALLTKIPKTNIVAVSSHYGTPLTYPFVSSLGFTMRNFGCPPVWGYLGINHYVDVHHMIQKCSIYRPNRRALEANENATLPLGTERSELRWFFYMAHNKNSTKDLYTRKALTQYQVGRSEDFPKCRAICDLLKLWYRKGENVGDEIISLGISSDGTFGIPKGLTFSQPVYLKVLEDESRVWVPYTNFPMPYLPLPLFQNFIVTALILNEKIAELRAESRDSRENFYSNEFE